MARKTEVQSFFLDYSDKSEHYPWLAKIIAFSGFEEEEITENISFNLTIQTDVSNKTPDEIRKETYLKLVQTCEEVLEDLKRIKL